MTDTFKIRESKPKQQDEFDDRVLEIRRVVRVVKGGKRFSFRAIVVVGDRKGRVGVGTGKGSDVVASIQKGKSSARKNMIHVDLHENRTIPYDIDAKYSAARVRLRPVRKGHGLVAGGAARVVLELVGVKDISAKIIGTTNNKLNNAMATMKALREFVNFTAYAEARTKKRKA